MHKIFCASGFIYHLPSQQILLQQPQHTNSPWVLFEKEHTEDQQPEEIFKENLLQLLNIKINNVYPIYAYFSEITNKNYSLLYTPVTISQGFPAKNCFTFRWFSFKDVLKIQATEQTKHDIIVGQRVIEAAGRKERGEHTFQ